MLTSSNGSKESAIDENGVCINEEKYHRFFLLKLNRSGKENVIKSIKLLEQRDDVVLVMPNYIDKLDTSKESMSSIDELTGVSYLNTIAPNDYTNKYGQWGIDRIDLPQAWTETTGSNTVIVGVMDTGIRGDHEDLSANIAPTDYHINCTNDGTSPLSDQYGHGTQIAGVIGAVGNNNKGTVGACWNIKLASLKVFAYDSEFNDYICTPTSFIDALSYAKIKKIPIVNFSGGGFSYSSDMLISLLDYQGLFVCCAGNEGVDISNTSNSYPARYHTDNMIVVAKGSDSTNDALYSDASYSATYVDLSAPGKNILTTDNDSTSAYVVTEGSSISAPYVTGVAALLKSKYPGMDAKALKDYIESNVDVIPALSGKVKTGGRLNAYKALTNLKEFTVTYDANGGGGAPMFSDTIIYGCATPLSKNTFGKSGCDFKGWHAQRTDTGKWYYTNGTTNGWYLEGSQPEGYEKYIYGDEQKISRTTTDGKTVRMVAVWEKKYNIEFVGNNATSGTVGTMTITSGHNYQMPGNVFARTGCTLDHWYVKDSEGNHYFASATDKDWYPLLSKPAAYTRISYAKNQIITTEDFEGLDYDETIYMYAYWEPNTGVLGDANMSGSVTVADATYIQKYLADIVDFTDDNQYILADVNFDGNITTADATLIQRYTGGIVDEFGM